MGERIRMVVTCSDRKHVRPPDCLRARNLPAGDVVARGHDWLDRLASAPVEPISASSLYMGEHWSVAASLLPLASAAGLPAELWVASAGYGLVPLGTALKPYAATFATAHADCVTRGAPPHALRHGRRTWWTTLASWPGPQPGAPRSLLGLAITAPGDRIIVAAGAAYVDAMAPDLEAARQTLEQRALLMIVSAGSQPRGGLSANFLPVDATLQPFFGGTRLSLNVRILAWLLRTQGQHRFRIEAVERELAKLPRAPHIAMLGDRLSDAEVLAYIRQQLSRADGNATKSRLLRTLRSSGGSCEQHRFSDLFGQATLS
jgi:hypothetical protein